MTSGSLKDYLERHPTIKTEQQIEIVKDIVRGMAYLEHYKVIHGDLAARNILLTNYKDTLIAKVGDFGMGKVSSNSVYYSKDSKIPAKWVAPEVIERLRYSNKSDAWSFGVVIWEIFSLGETPYPGMSNEEVVVMVLRGETMTVPENVPTSMATIMKKCWGKNPDNRPSFKEIANEFEVKDEVSYLSLEKSQSSENLNLIYVNLPSGEN